MKNKAILKVDDQAFYLDLDDAATIMRLLCNAESAKEHHFYDRNQKPRSDFVYSVEPHKVSVTLTIEEPLTDDELTTLEMNKRLEREAKEKGEQAA